MLSLNEDSNLGPRKPLSRLHQLQKRHFVSRGARDLKGLKNNMTLINYLNTRNWSNHSNVDFVQIARNHPPFMWRLDYSKSLPVHEGCVNTICWNSTGEYILSGSDDCNLCITKPGDMFDTSVNYTVLHKVPTHHLGNIFCARFIPNSADKKIVSCSSEGPIIVHDIDATDPSEGILKFNCHSETIYEVVPVGDDDKVFLSCGEDKTIRLFDMRVHRSCARAGTCPHPALIRNSHAMTTLQLHPLNSNLMLVGRADGVGLVYDRRKLPDVTKFTREQAHADRIAGIESPSYRFKHPLEGVVSQFSVPDMEEKCRFTSLCYNKNGSEVLASYTSDYIYLFNHDRSSNFELIQTLPKKANKATGSSADEDSNSNDRNASDNTRLSSSRDQTSALGHGNGRARGAASRSPRSARISRIRVRGDWSDTGVNSVPLSARPRHEASNNTNDSNSSSGGNDLREPLRTTPFLEQVAVTMGTRGLNMRRFIPTEIIAGPIVREGSRSSANLSSSNNSRQEQVIAEEVESDGNQSRNNDNEEGDNDEDDNSTLIDDDERISSDDEEDEDVDDIEENFQRYAEMTVRDLVDEANEQAQRIMRNEESTMMDLDESGGDDDGERGRESQQSKASSEGGTGGRRGLSSSTKEKFKRTLEDLKNKYMTIPSFKPRIKYQGHRNSRTSIKESIFWGDDYIMSGSDCGRIMVWEKATAKLVMAFKADERVVNCLAPNPSTYVLASSGIDYDIKLWSTQGLKEAPLAVDEAEMKRIVENNELMLEESRYTLSVPPHLFFRVLASLVQSSR